MKKILSSKSTVHTLQVTATVLCIVALYLLTTLLTSPTLTLEQNTSTAKNELRALKVLPRPYLEESTEAIEPIDTVILDPETTLEPEAEMEPQPEVDQASAPEESTEPMSVQRTALISEPAPTMKTMAWIYPGAPACSASTEYADGRNIDVLKAEFFTIRDGKLTKLTSECNAYTLENIVQLKTYSTEQYVTISAGDPEGMGTFLAKAITAPNTDITTLVNFVTDNNLTGIELDFEGYGSWTPTMYKNYKSFVSVLGNALHAKGKKLMIDGPAVANASEEASWYLWRYADFVNLPVDTIVVMAYDYQYDYGAGAPVAPLTWLKNVTTYISSKYPKSKITIGLPSYGYKGTKEEYDIKILTREQMSKLPGYTTAKRDVASGEMTWQTGSTVHFYQDATSLQLKRDAVAKLGITSISIWHLGGNSWFK